MAYNSMIVGPTLGGGGGGESFTIVQPDNGTSPTADSSTDTLTFTSSDDSINILGDSAADSLDFKIDINALTAEGTLDTAADYLMIYDASAGALRKTLLSNVGGGGTEDMVFSSSAAGEIPLLLQGSASQTADLFKVEDSSAAEKFSIEAGGTLRVALQAAKDTGFSIGPIGGGTNHGINFYQTGNNAVTTIRAANGSAMRLDSGGLLITSTSYAIRSGVNGSLGSCAYTFDNDRSTGMIRNGSNNLGLVADGVLGLNLSSTAATSPIPFRPGEYATGSLPTASSFEGHIVYDTTTQTMKWSNGTIWATI